MRHELEGLLVNFFYYLIVILSLFTLLAYSF